jgi:phosphatidylglycerophosphatase C
MIDFLWHAVPAARLLSSVPALAPNALAFMLGRRDNARFKEDILTRFFAGQAAVDFDRRAADYADRRLPRLIRRAALERLRWHIVEGHRVVIATASLEAYVRPWASRNGLDEVLGTRLEVDVSGRLTGKLQGPNCYGAEKVARLRALVGNAMAGDLYVYGDSRGDRELLSLATYPAYRPFRGRHVVTGSS